MGAGLRRSGALMQTDVSAAAFVCGLTSALNMKGTSLALGATTCVLLLTTVARLCWFNEDVLGEFTCTRSRIKSVYAASSGVGEIAPRHEKPSLKWLPHITPHN